MTIRLRPTMLVLAVIILPMMAAWTLNYTSSTVKTSTMVVRVTELFENPPGYWLIHKFDHIFGTCQFFSVVLPVQESDVSLVERVLIHLMHQEAPPKGKRRDYCSGLHKAASRHGSTINAHPDWELVTNINPDYGVYNAHFKTRYWFTQKSVYMLISSKINDAANRILLLAITMVFCIGIILVALISRRNGVIITIVPLGLFTAGLSALSLWEMFALALPLTVCVAGIFGLMVVLISGKRWAPYWCLGFGVVGQLFWWWDYSHVLVLAAIGVLSYFWWNRNGTADCIRAWCRTIAWCGCYLGGWVAAFVVGLLVRQWAFEHVGVGWTSPFVSTFQGKAELYWNKQFDSPWSEWFIPDVGRWIEQVSSSWTMLPLISIVGVVGIIVWLVLKEYRSNVGVTHWWYAVSDMGLILVVILSSLIQLAIHSDDEHIGSRYMFVPAALVVSLVLLLLLHLVRAFKRNSMMEVGGDQV